MCVGSINKIINEKIVSICNQNKGNVIGGKFKSAGEQGMDTFLNQNTTIYHVKQIIEHDNDEGVENHDFLPNAIKGCEVLANTLHKFQETNCVSKNECVTDIYKACYSIANNLAEIFERDETQKNFYNNHELRIDGMLKYNKEERYLQEFIEDQRANYETMVKNASSAISR